MKNFEERLSELEELNKKMKEGEVTLAEAVSLFERGIKLATSLEKDLSKIERKVEILVNEPDTPDEEPNLELFSEDSPEEENKESSAASEGETEEDDETS